MDGVAMEVADAGFQTWLQYVIAAVRLDTEAVNQDDVTAGRLRRLAVEFRRRAGKLAPELV